MGGIRTKKKQKVNYLSVCKLLNDLSYSERQNVTDRYNPFNLPSERQKRNMFYVCRGIRKHSISNLTDKEVDRIQKYVKKANLRERFISSHLSAVDYMERRYGVHESI